MSGKDRQELLGYILAVQELDQSTCRTSHKPEWREMVAATIIRSVYIFAVDTTVEQDEKFIAEFNNLPNKNNFNGVTRNCAGFTRATLWRLAPIRN